MIRDATVQLRQLLRDRGPTPAVARQAAKLLLRSAGGARPGRRIEGIRRPAALDFSMAVPFGYAAAEADAPALRVAAVCHLFHADLAGEFRPVLAGIPGPLDLLLTTDSEAKRAAIAAAFAGWDKGGLTVRVVPNRGRDIGPKLAAWADVHAHDLVLYLHSKRDTHFVDGSAWRRYLLHTLAGSPAIAGSIAEAFRRDPRLGIVMPQHWGPLRDRLDWATIFSWPATWRAG